ncbi:MAG: prephenate dehydrogenase [Dehalococcoidia bacterium]
MSRSRITIVGTGLIGASVGLGLMSRKDRQYEVIGIDRDRDHARTAKKAGAVDREVPSLEEAFEGAGLVILAVPVQGARKVLEDGSRYLAEGAIVTDTCSTKADMMRWAAEFLPETVHFVGGHPMAGKEQSGPESAAADMFKDATWAITPSPRAHEGAVSTVLGMVESLGANPLYIDAAEHDTYAAAVSHLPILLSVALFRMVRDSKGWEDASLLAGPAFRDLTRLASGDPTMSRDIMATNREAVLHWLTRFQDELATARKALEEGGQTVTDMFASTQLDRENYITNPPVRRRPDGPEAPSSQDALGRLFVGGLYDKLKEAGQRAATLRPDDGSLRRKLEGDKSDRDGER